MAVDRGRYFIGIIPPPPLYARAFEIKQYFNDEYQTKASLNSPPHLTLQQPFEWSKSKEEDLVETLRKFSAGLNLVRIQLKDFGCFAPRVIFIQVVVSAELTALQAKVREFCKKELGLFDANYQDKPFHPHLTVAFRDLRKAMFAKAWDEFRNRKFEGKFLADKITLLKHDGKRWNAAYEFPLVRR